MPHLGHPTDDLVITAVTPPTQARSGSQVLNITEGGSGGEWPWPYVAGQFTNPVNQVSAWVGFVVPPPGADTTPVQLDAYDADGNRVGTDTVTVSSTVFNTQLSVRSATTNIGRFLIWSTPTWKVGIDDLSFTPGYRGTDGFAFANYTNASGYTMADLSALFGPQATYGGGGGAPNPFVSKFLTYAQDLNDGQCYGISRVTEQMLHGDRATSSYARQPGFAQVSNPTIWELDGPSGPSANLRNDIHVQHLAQWSAESVVADVQEHNKHSAASFKGADLYAEVNTALIAGDHPIISIFWKNSSTGTTDGHAVVAYALDNDPSSPGAFWIDVYDSNLPFLAPENTSPSQNATRESASRIHVDSGGNWSLTYPGYSPFTNTASSLWVTPYSTVPVQPSYPSESQLNNFWSMFSAGSAATTQVTDAAGHTLLNPDGTQNNDPATRLSNSLRLFPIQGPEVPGIPLDVVPVGGTYTETVTGTGNGTYSEYVLGHGFGVALASVPAAAGVADQMMVSPGDDAFTFQTGAASKDLAAEFIVQPPSGPARVVDAHTTSFGGGSDAFAFDAARQAITVTHLGGAAPLSLTFTQPDAAGVVESFATGPIGLAPGDMATVTPANWSSLATSTATLTITHADGTRVTLTLPSQFTAQPPITVSLARQHGRPLLQVFDAASGTLMFRLFPFGKSYRGPVRFVVADLNWDGTYEIAVVQGKGGNGTVRVFDGRTGALRYTLRPFRKRMAGVMQLVARQSHGVWFLVASARPKGKMVQHCFGGPGLREMPMNVLA
jgi:hypothetical protein